MPLLELWCVEEGQTGNEIVTAPVKGAGLTAAPGMGDVKGALFFPLLGLRVNPVEVTHSRITPVKDPRCRRRSRVDIIPHC